MPDVHHTTPQQRRYRVAQAATIAGSLAGGLLVLNRLVDALRDDFFLYYGISDAAYAQAAETASAQVPLTIGQLAVASLMLFAVIFFIWNERRRVRRLDEMHTRCVGCESRELVSVRMSRGAQFDLLITRTSIYAGALLLAWALQQCAERWLSGMGWGLEYADWRSLLPLASIFGLCVIAGLVVAAISLFGLRAIFVLEHVLDRLRSWRRVRVVSLVPTVGFRHTARTFRELMGCDILSRPPPVAC
jgi:hypothetical protein